MEKFTKQQSISLELIESREELFQNLLKPYTNILFLVHPFFHPRILIEDLKSNDCKNVFKNERLRRLVKFSTDQEFTHWKNSVGFNRSSDDYNTINLRRKFQSLVKYKQMYFKYKQLLQAQNPNRCLSIIIPAKTSLSELPTPLQKRYRDFAKIQGVSIPDPNKICSEGAKGIQPNMRFTYANHIAEWIFEALNDNQDSDLQVLKPEFVKSLIEKKINYFEKIEFSVAGEYENLCVADTATGIKLLTNRKPKILSEFSFKTY
jgi:hypothetical protein